MGSNQWDLVLGGVVAASVTLAVTGLRQQGELKRARSHLGARLVESFERFASSCADVRAFHLNSRAENPYDWTAVASLPPAPPLPEDDAGWRAFEPAFSIFARTFAMRIERAQGAIRWEAEQSDVGDTAYEVERYAASLGVEALSFAKNLRERYNFGVADFGWDVEGHLGSELARIAAGDEARAEANRKMWAEMEGLENNTPDD